MTTTGSDRSQVRKVGQTASKPLTLIQANALIERANSLFNRATRAWVRGDDTGTDAGLRHGEKQCDRFRAQAEALLAPLGIVVDYPVLSPSFTVNGYSYHTTESAVSAALEVRT